MLNFWASWCPPCADEAPDLNALSVRYGSLGVRFVGVDFNDAVDEARAFAKRHDVPYALVHDTRGVRQAFGVSAPPETYVIDGSGRAVVRIEGPVDTPLLEPYVRIAAARSGRAVPLDPDVKVAGKSLASLRGSPLLIAFVAPDCAACTTLLQRLHGLGGRARVIALSEGGSVEGAVADPPDTSGRGGGQAQRDLGVTSFPTLLAIDARGRLVAAPIGLPGACAGARGATRGGGVKRLYVPALGLVVVLAAAALIAGALGAFRPGAAPEHGWTVAQLSTELMCPTCKTRLDQSDSPQANQIRRELVRLQSRGESRSAAKRTLAAEYGSEVLADTPRSGFGALAWLAPTALLLAGGALAVLLARRWRAVAAPAPALASAERERLEQQLDDELARLE